MIEILANQLQASQHIKAKENEVEPTTSSKRRVRKPGQKDKTKVK